VKRLSNDRVTGVEGPLHWCILPGSGGRVDVSGSATARPLRSPLRPSLWVDLEWGPILNV
jgi:hypothetical protein